MNINMYVHVETSNKICMHNVDISREGTFLIDFLYSPSYLEGSKRLFFDNYSMDAANITKR